MSVQLPGTEATSAFGHSPLDGHLHAPVKKVQWIELGADLEQAPLLLLRGSSGSRPAAYRHGVPCLR